MNQDYRVAMSRIVSAGRRRAAWFAALFMCLALGSTTVRAQASPEMLLSEETQVADELGNARFNVKIKLTAKQYLVWKQKYGSNPSILRRDMGRLTSQYETSNFKLEQDDMNREIRISMDANGVVTHKGGGEFEFKVPKEWTGGQRVNNEYRFNYVQSLGPGALMQHSVAIVLPERAGNMHDQLSEEGDKVIQYRLPQKSHGTGWIAGTIVFGILGVAGIALGLTGKSPSAAPPPTPTSPAPTP